MSHHKNSTFQCIWCGYRSCRASNHFNIIGLTLVPWCDCSIRISLIVLIICERTENHIYICVFICVYMYISSIAENLKILQYYSKALSLCPTPEQWQDIPKLLNWSRIWIWFKLLNLLNLPEWKIWRAPTISQLTLFMTKNRWKMSSTFTLEALIPTLTISLLCCFP